MWYVGFFTRFPNLRSSGSDGGNMCPSVNNLLRASNTSFLSSSASPFTQVSDGWWPKDLVKLLPYISCSFIHTQLALNLFSRSCIFIPIDNARFTSQTLYLDVYLHQLATDLGGIGPSFHTIQLLTLANPSSHFLLYRSTICGSGISGPVLTMLFLDSNPNRRAFSASTCIKNAVNL